MTDAQGRVIVGTAAGLALGAKVGTEQVTLSSAQMPAHAHGVSDPGYAHVVDNTINYSIPPVFSTAGGQGVGQASISSRTSTTGVSIQNTGGGQPFDNRQASLALLYCKKN
jgi:microcystin-dependent protein